MDDELMSLGEYLSLNARIRQLEKKILAQNDTICRLRKRLGVRQKTIKSELIDLIMGGTSPADAAKALRCDRSTAYTVYKELVAAGAVAKRDTKREVIEGMIRNGKSDADIAASCGASIVWVRKVRCSMT